MSVTCRACAGTGKIQVVDPMDNSYFLKQCLSCEGKGTLGEAPTVRSIALEEKAKRMSTCRMCGGSGHVNHIENFDGSYYCGTCPSCGGRGTNNYVVPNGRLIDAATDVMRAQRRKGIEKYKSTLEDQNGYTVGGMIDMVAEELADGSVYIQKVREQYLALLDEIQKAVDTDYAYESCVDILNIIKRERGNV